MSKIKLFCLPYAGGSASVYGKWKKHLNHNIELIPVELAGRGRRFNTPFYGSISEAIQDIYSSIKTQLKGHPYALFGHSMGALLAFELAYELKKKGHHPPEHIFFSGRCPPHIEREKENLYLLPDEEFKEEILKIGGTPKEVFESEELSSIFIPVLKADYKIVEIYEYAEKDGKLECGVTAMRGRYDTGTPSHQMEEWKNHAGKDFRSFDFDGGHFYIHTQWEGTARLINDTLQVT